jgi:ABC-type transporter Mla MlaB component
MLRIFIFEELYTTTLRLEGQLTRESIPLLMRRWGEVHAPSRDRKPVIDLGDVSDVDESGHSTLRWLVRSGAILSNVQTGKVAAMLEDVICNDPARGTPKQTIGRLLRRLGCNGDKSDIRAARACRLLCALIPNSLRPCACRTA